VAASGCLPITQYLFDFGAIVVSGRPGLACGPRSTVLDKLLVDAAAEAGAEVREGFTLDEVPRRTRCRLATRSRTLPARRPRVRALQQSRTRSIVIPGSTGGLSGADIGGCWVRSEDEHVILLVGREGGEVLDGAGEQLLDVVGGGVVDA
jgi:hypothetical protein